jgi:phage replication-related protein YjqB (UPF0714/DUF867 family)
VISDMDIYSTFESLKQNELEGADYRIRWRMGSSGITILSIHGGEIEPGTTRIANAIAGWEHSFYSFEGTKRARNRALHITSTRFDEPIALQIVCQSEIIISIHGSAQPEPLVQLGGLDVELKRRILNELVAADLPALECGALPFGGTDQKNICNLCGRGMGVQMEISRGLRAMMFRDLTPEGRRHPTHVFTCFTGALRKAIAPFAIIYAHPLRNTD